MPQGNGPSGTKLPPKDLLSQDGGAAKSAPAIAAADSGLKPPPVDLLAGTNPQQPPASPSAAPAAPPAQPPAPQSKFDAMRQQLGVPTVAEVPNEPMAPGSPYGLQVLPLKKDTPARRRTAEFMLGKYSEQLMGRAQTLVAAQEQMAAESQALKNDEETLRLAGQSPSVSPDDYARMSEEFRQRVEQFNQSVGTLNKEQAYLKEANAAIQKQYGAIVFDDLARDVEAKMDEAKRREQGSFGGAIGLSLLKGTGSAVAGATDIALTGGNLLSRLMLASFGYKGNDGAADFFLDGLSGGVRGTGTESSRREARQKLLEAIRTKPEQTGRDYLGIGTTNEYYAKAQEGFWGGAVLGLGQSVPAMITPGMVGILAQVNDNLQVELSDPKFDDMSPEAKTGLGILMGLPAMALERIGFRNLTQNKPFMSRLAASIAAKLPKGASAEAVMSVVNAETSSAVANFMSRLAGGAMSEFETGLEQQVVDQGIRLAYNRLSENGGLENPDTFLDAAIEAIYAGGQEAVGGGIMATPLAIRSAVKSKRLSANPEATNVIVDAAASTAFETSVSEYADNQAAAGDISPAEAEDMKANAATMHAAATAIPDYVQGEDRAKAFELLMEKQQLSSQDKSLTAGRIAQIDAELSAISDKALGVAKDAAESLKKPAQEPATQPAETQPTEAPQAQEQQPAQDAQATPGDQEQAAQEEGSAQGGGVKVGQDLQQPAQEQPEGQQEQVASTSQKKGRAPGSGLGTEADPYLSENGKFLVWKDSDGVIVSEQAVGEEAFSARSTRNRIKESLGRDKNYVAKKKARERAEREFQKKFGGERVVQETPRAVRDRVSLMIRKSDATALGAQGRALVALVSEKILPSSIVAEMGGTRGRFSSSDVSMANYKQLYKDGLITKEAHDAIAVFGSDSGKSIQVIADEVDVADSDEARADMAMEIRDEIISSLQHGYRNVTDVYRSIESIIEDTGATLTEEERLEKQHYDRLTREAIDAGVTEDDFDRALSSLDEMSDDELQQLWDEHQQARANEEQVQPKQRGADGRTGPVSGSEEQGPKQQKRKQSKGDAEALKNKPITKRMIDSAKKALAGIGVDLKVVAPATQQEYNKAVEAVGNDGAESAWGIYDPRTQTIYVNPSGPDLKQTFYHEAAHPVLLALAKADPGRFVKFADQIIDEAGGKYDKYARDNYGDLDEVGRAAEALAEFMGDVAAGRVPVSTKAGSLWQSVKEFLRQIAEMLGFGPKEVDLSKPENVRKFASEFARAMRSGAKISGLVKGAQTAKAALSKDVERLVDGWYSRLDDAVKAKGNTAPASQWAKWLEARAKEGAISMEEAKWTGLSDWLASKDNEKVTPQQVREFLRDNRVKVEVKVNGGVSDNIRIVEGQYDDGAPSFDLYDGDEYVESYESRELAEANIANYNNVSSDTKFSQYQLPGGQNYREVLVTLPLKTTPDQKKTPAQLAKELYGADSIYDLNPEQQAEIVKRNQLTSDQLRAARYDSGHFDEPNILVHLRLNDRTDADGKKVLFIEELQSDWGQKGKKEGFRKEGDITKDQVESAYAKAYTKADEAISLLPEDLRDGLKGAVGMDLAGDLLATQYIKGRVDAGSRVPALLDEANELYAQAQVLSMQYERSMGSPPSAPFVTSTDAWVELGLKQAIRMAVEGGYDKIAWTTGEQQNERYDLSKQVEDITWAERVGANGETQRRVRITPIGTDDVFTIYVGADGIVQESDSDTAITNAAEGKRLDEVVGKDVADRIMAEPSGMLSGDGLKVGGSGMKGFYDKILPTVAKKVSKRLGGDGVVGNVVIGKDQQVGDRVGRQQSIAITPEMAMSVKSGVPLFQKPKTSPAPNDVWNSAIDSAVGALKPGTSASDAIKVGVQNIKNSSWYKSATPEDQKASVKDFKKTLSKAWGVKQKPAQPRPKAKKILVDERQALKDQIRIQARIAKQIAADLAKTKAAFAKAVGDHIKENLYGKIKPRQASAITRAALKVNPLSPKSVAKFAYYVDRVIQDANYAEEVRQAVSIRAKAKKLAGRKNIPINHKEALKRIASINPRGLSDVQEYNVVVGRYLDTFASPTSARYKPGDTREINQYLDAAYKDSQKGYAEMLAEEYGLDADSELSAKLLKDALDAADYEEYVKGLESDAQREILEERISKQAKYSQDGLRLYEGDLTESEKRILKSLGDVDIDLLSPEQQLEFIRAADNIIVNDAFYGADRVAVLADATSAMPEATKATERLGGRRLNLNTTAAAFAENFESLSDAFRRVFGISDVMAKVSVLLGIESLDRSTSAWHKDMNDIALAYSKGYSELAKKHKDINTEKTMVDESVVSFALQGIDGKTEDEALSIRKKVILDDIKVKRESRKRGRNKQAEMAQVLYDNVLAGAKTYGEVIAALRKYNQGAHESIKLMQQVTAKYADFIRENSELFWNERGTWGDPNYLPIKWVRSDIAKEDVVTPEDARNTGARSLRSSVPKANMSKGLSQRRKYVNLPAGKMLSYATRRNVLKSLSDNLYDAHTSRDWERIRQFMKMPGAKQVFGSQENADYVSRKLTDVASSSNVVFSDETARFVDNTLTNMKRYLSGLALGGVLQVPKQLADASVNVVLNAGSLTGYLSNLRSTKEASDLLNQYSIGRRGAIKAGTEWNTISEVDMTRLRKALSSDSKAVKGAKTALEVASDILMKSLTASDALAAKASWLTYYEKYLGDKGVKRGSWKSEADLVKNDKVRMEAAAYANNMVDRTQVSSDPSNMAPISKRTNNAWGMAVRAALMQFSSFTVQAKSRLFTAVADMKYYARFPAYEKDGTPTPEGQRFAAAAREFAATQAGMITFALVAKYFVGALYEGGANIWAALFGGDDDDKERELEFAGSVMQILYVLRLMDTDIYRMSQKARRDAKKPPPTPEQQQEKAKLRVKQALSKVFLDGTIGGVVPMADDKLIDTINWTYYQLAADGVIDDPGVLNKDGSIKKYAAWRKEPSLTPLYRYGQWDPNKPSLGFFDMIGSTFDETTHIFQPADKGKAQKPKKPRKLKLLDD